MITEGEDPTDDGDEVTGYFNKNSSELSRQLLAIYQNQPS